MASPVGDTIANGSFRDEDQTAYPWPWHLERELRRVLIEEEREVRSIAADWECTPRTIHRAIDKHELREAIDAARE